MTLGFMIFWLLLVLRYHPNKIGFGMVAFLATTKI
jgi:hypothetical protein